jgi:hypothetical protein
LLDALSLGTQRERLLPFCHELGLQLAVHGFPHFTVFGPIAPISVKSGSRTLSLAHQKEAAIAAAAGLLRGGVQRKVPLVSGLAALDKINSIFVGSSAIASLTVPLDSLNGLRRVRVAGVPNARSAVVLAEQHATHISEQIEGQQLQAALRCLEAQQGLNILIDG